MFQIIVFLHNLIAIELQGMFILLQDFLVKRRINGSINYCKSSKSWSTKATQTTTLPPPCLTVGMMLFLMNCCVIFTSDVTGPKLLSHTEHFPKSLWDNQDLFGKYEQAFVFKLHVLNVWFVVRYFNSVHRGFLQSRRCSVFKKNKKNIVELQTLHYWSNEGWDEKIRKGCL